VWVGMWVGGWIIRRIRYLHFLDKLVTAVLRFTVMFHLCFDLLDPCLHLFDGFAHCLLRSCVGMAGSRERERERD